MEMRDMDTRAINLGTPQIEMLRKIADAGCLPLDDMQLDDFMLLGGQRLIALQVGNVSLTPRGARFLAYATEPALSVTPVASAAEQASPRAF